MGGGWAIIVFLVGIICSSNHSASYFDISWIEPSLGLPAGTEDLVETTQASGGGSKVNSCFEL